MVLHQLPDIGVYLLIVSFVIFNSSFQVDYSVLKLFTGLAIAALIACTLTEIIAIAIASTAAAMNIHALMFIL